MSEVNWRGDELREKVRRAEKTGIMKTVSECLKESKHLVNKDTGTLQRSLKTEAPDVSRDGVSVRWGSFDVNYAFWQEVLPAEKGGKAYLRPSADKNYPRLAGFIQESMK